MFWVVDEAPVSMAAIVRRTRHATAISLVYTPLRNRGYVGAAALVERIGFALARRVFIPATCLRRQSKQALRQRGRVRLARKLLPHGRASEGLGGCGLSSYEST
jgi:hypothetical protein